MVRETKQVIVMRKDLKMRKGKMITQGAHASVLAILNQMSIIDDFTRIGKNWTLHTNTLEDPIHKWLTGDFTKITVSVESENELFNIYEQALSVEDVRTNTNHVKMPCAIVQDSGKTEFGGIPTYTCVAIGPWWSDQIDKITGALSLL